MIYREVLLKIDISNETLTKFSTYEINGHIFYSKSKPHNIKETQRSMDPL